MRVRSMISRRLSALSLVLVTFAGCHEDPKVQNVIVPGAATALAINTDGGQGSTPTNSAGTGRNAGTITARVLGDLNLGGSTTIGAATLPATPTTGTFPLSPVAGFTGPGTVIVSGAVSLSAAASVTFRSDTGDLVISGILQTTDVGKQADISLEAPNGTVFVTGSVLATSADGTASADQGGTVTITAARIVVTGTIKTQGEAGPATGGAAGAISMTSSTGPVIITGTLLAAGGTGTTGGKGGDV